MNIEFETFFLLSRIVFCATQNPPSKYAGRKQLSRAFRYRSIELHFDELPEDELLLCRLPESYAKLLIRTVSELKSERSDEALKNFVWTATAKRTALPAGNGTALVLSSLSKLLQL